MEFRGLDDTSVAAGCTGFYRRFNAQVTASQGLGENNAKDRAFYPDLSPFAHQTRSDGVNSPSDDF